MTGKEYIEYRINTGDRFLVNLHKDSRELLALILENYAALRQPPVVRSLPLDDFLKKLFQNNSDCYADTWSQDGLGAPMVEGEVIQAMTVEQFIKVVKSIWQ